MSSKSPVEAARLARAQIEELFGMPVESALAQRATSRPRPKLSTHTDVVLRKLITRKLQSGWPNACGRALEA